MIFIHFIFFLRFFFFESNKLTSDKSIFVISPLYSYGTMHGRAKAHIFTRTHAYAYALAHAHTCPAADLLYPVRVYERVI